MATTYKDYYQTLGVKRDANQKDIKAAFRKLARKYHPDVNRDDKDAEARFKEINEAHEVLGDPEKRKKYDELGPDWERAQQFGGFPGFGGGGRGQRVHYQTVTPEQLEQMFGRSDPFSDFFYNVFGSRGFEGATSQPQARAQPLETETTVSLEEAFAGTNRRVTIDDGRRRQVEVQIPAGIKDGARVRAAGRGGEGDLYIRVHLAPHARFTRSGDDVRTTVEVPLAVAVGGGQVEVPTLKGTRVSLTIPGGTQNRRVLRLRGLGMPKLRGGGAGDLLAEVNIRLPEPPPPALLDWAAADQAKTE